MDHHCPFTNCWVGLWNEGFFFLWLSLAACAGFSELATVFLLCIMQGMMRGVETLSNSDITRCVVMGRTSFIFLPAISVSLYVHPCWLASLSYSHQLGCVCACVHVCVCACVRLCVLTTSESHKAHVLIAIYLPFLPTRPPLPASLTYWAAYQTDDNRCMVIFRANLFGPGHPRYRLVWIHCGTLMENEMTAH
jgi:hypothetical protein